MIHYFDRSRLETDPAVLSRYMEFVSPEPMSGCWLWTGVLTLPVPNGYGRFTLNGKKCLAHQLSWRFWRGDITEPLFVLHSCDIRCCVNPSHLFLGTYKDNALDKVRKGRSNVPKGCDNYMSKLTPDDVANIRKLRRVVSQRELARRYNMNYITIGKVQRGQSYVNTLL